MQVEEKGKTSNPENHTTESLIPKVYDELRRLAASKLRHEAAGQTLSGTALVHEVFLRMNSGNNDPQWENEQQFFYAAAEAMRWIIVDRFRAKSRAKRGSNAEKVQLEELEIAGPESDDRLLVINEALVRLEEDDPESAELVKLRFFVGLTMEEIAEILGMSVRSLRRRWSFARAWLARDLGSD